MPDFTIVRVVNRSQRAVSCFFDGAQHTLQPGETRAVLSAVAAKMKAQNPVMGTADPMSIDARDGDFLVGVIEWGDPTTPIEQSAAPERFDSSLIPAKPGHKRALEGARIPQRQSRAAVSPPASTDPGGTVFADNGV